MRLRNRKWIFSFATEREAVAHRLAYRFLTVLLRRAAKRIAMRRPLAEKRAADAVTFGGNRGIERPACVATARECASGMGLKRSAGDSIGRDA